MESIEINDVQIDCIIDSIVLAIDRENIIDTTNEIQKLINTNNEIDIVFKLYEKKIIKCQKIKISCRKLF